MQTSTSMQLSQVEVRARSSVSLARRALATTTSPLTMPLLGAKPEPAYRLRPAVSTACTICCTLSFITALSLLAFMRLHGSAESYAPSVVALPLVALASVTLVALACGWACTYRHSSPPALASPPVAVALLAASLLLGSVRVGAYTRGSSLHPSWGATLLPLVLLIAARASRLLPTTSTPRVRNELVAGAPAMEVWAERLRRAAVALEAPLGLASLLMLYRDLQAVGGGGGEGGSEASAGAAYDAESYGAWLVASPFLLLMLIRLCAGAAAVAALGSARSVPEAVDDRCDWVIAAEGRLFWGGMALLTSSVALASVACTLASSFHTLQQAHLARPSSPHQLPPPSAAPASPRPDSRPSGADDPALWAAAYSPYVTLLTLILGCWACCCCLALLVCSPHTHHTHKRSVTPPSEAATTSHVAAPPAADAAAGLAAAAAARRRHGNAGGAEGREGPAAPLLSGRAVDSSQPSSSSDGDALF